MMSPSPRQKEAECETVDNGAAVDRRQHAERDRDEQRQRERDGAERHRHRHARGDERRDAVTVVEGIAEIEMHRAPQPVEILQRHRPVEAELVADLLDLRRRRLGSGDRGGEIAGQVQQEKGDD
jgi:hypothetical protein